MILLGNFAYANEKMQKWAKRVRDELLTKARRIIIAMTYEK